MNFDKQSSSSGEDKFWSMIYVNGTKSMELFVNGDAVSDSELHSFVSVEGLSFVIFKYASFKNIMTTNFCSGDQYENDVGLINANQIDLFNVMECSFENITLNSYRHIIRGDNILNHMILNSNASDITLADKSRVIYMTDFEELVVEGISVQSVQYS